MKKNVLVIDDEKDICELIKIFLQGLGYEVLTAQSGPEGLNKCDDSVHIVITDRQMPGGMLGEEVIHRIKELYPQIKAFLMTGEELNGDVKRAIKAAGVEEILSKPFSLDKLEQVLQRQGRR